MIKKVSARNLINIYPEILIEWIHIGFIYGVLLFPLQLLRVVNRHTLLNFFRSKDLYLRYRGC